MRSGAFAVASSDGSGSSQAVAQATASNGGDNTLTPGVGGTYTPYSQYPLPKGLGYDPSELGNYNPQALATGPMLGNTQAQQNTLGGINPYSLPSNLYANYPAAGSNLYPNPGYNFAPQVSNAQAQAFGSSSSSAQAQAQANVLQPVFPTVPLQNYPWDNMSPGYISAQPQSVAGIPAQIGAPMLGQGYYPYGQAHPPQSPYNSVYPSPVSSFPDYGTAQVQPNAAEVQSNAPSARRNTEYMRALVNEDLDNRRFHII